MLVSLVLDSSLLISSLRMMSSVSRRVTKAAIALGSWSILEDVIRAWKSYRDTLKTFMTFSRHVTLTVATAA